MEAASLKSHKAAKTQQEVADILLRIAAASNAGDVRDALRWTDRLYRLTGPHPDVTLLHLKTLLLADRHQEAGAIIDGSDMATLSPSFAEIALRLYLRLGRVDDAVELMRRALEKFAVDPETPLALAFRQVAHQSAGPLKAWSGLASDFKVWGEVFENVNADFIQVVGPANLDTHIAFTVAGAPDLATSDTIWRFQSSTPVPFGVCVKIAGHEILGRKAPGPIAFGLDGRSVSAGNGISGWIRTDWFPDLPVDIIARTASGVQLNTSPSPLDETGRRSFGFEKVPNDGPVQLLVVTPDGATTPLPDSPLTRSPSKSSKRSSPLTSSVPRPLGRSSTRSRKRDMPSGRPAYVIIPVYRGYEETLACIHSVLKTKPAGVSVVVVNDASPDRELVDALRRLAKKRDIRLLSNTENLGYPTAVNRAINLSPDKDVILLNSDTEVLPGWFSRLEAAAYSVSNIGTVTPLSNNGSIASYPSAAGTVHCNTEFALEISEVAAKVNDGVIIETPTGVGFCLYIRRACLEEVGPFDAELFGRGYGEENDFCRRAEKSGWRNVIAADVFVRHEGARSFGASRAALIERNAAHLSARHPEYDELVTQFISTDPLSGPRRRLDEHRLRHLGVKFDLLVSMALPGGVKRFVEQRCQGLKSQGATPLVLRATVDDHIELVVFEDEQRFPNLIYSSAESLSGLVALLETLDFRHIEIHHFMGMPGPLIEWLRKMGVDYHVFLHDYAWICPRISLFDDRGQYCGEPEVAQCEICIANSESYLERDLSVPELRERSRSWLADAEQVFAPTADTALRFKKYFPDTKIKIIPWEGAHATEKPLAAQSLRRRASGAATKIAIIGAIGPQKGYEIVKACAANAQARSLPLEFLIYGYTEDDQALMDAGPVFVTGRYAEHEIQNLLARDEPDLAFFPSLTPETWCYTLTHALDAGLPCIGFDIGAVGERLRAAKAGHAVIPLGLAPGQINDALLDFKELTTPKSSSPPETSINPNNSRDIPEHHLKNPTFDSFDFQPEPTLSSEPPRLQVAPAFTALVPTPHALVRQGASSSLEQPMPPVARAITSTVEIITLNKGVFVFTVKNAAPTRTGDDGGLYLPAVHVGLGPGVPPENVEIMPGIRNAAGWLYERMDVLILKVNVSGSHLVITSLRGQGMAPLNLNVERMDDGRDRAALSGPPATPKLPPPNPKPSAIPNQMVADPGRSRVRVQVQLKLARERTVSSTDLGWVGAIGEQLAIEGLAILPLEAISADRLQYKALAADGYETPWTSGGATCSAIGTGAPLIGFAIRLVNGAETMFDVLYRGAFRSGVIVGPVANGAPCQLKGKEQAVLDAIELIIVSKGQPQQPVQPPAMANAPEQPQAVRALGPKFSIFRDDGF